MLSITVNQPSFVIHHPLSNMKLLTVSTFCSIAILTCADNVKDASALNKESGAFNNVDLAMSLSYITNLNPGESLVRNSQLISPNGRFHLDMQQDGNLVLYRTDDNKPIWHTDTRARVLGTHRGGDYAIMQKDGNLVVYSVDFGAIWDSKTNGRGECDLRVQDDC